MARVKGDWLYSYHNSLDRDPKVKHTVMAGIAAAAQCGLIKDKDDLVFMRQRPCSLPFFAEDCTLDLMREVQVESVAHAQFDTLSPDRYDIPFGIVAMMALGPACLAEGQVGPNLFNRPEKALPLEFIDPDDPQRGVVVVDIHTRSYKGMDADGNAFKLQVLYLIPVEWAERNLHFYMVVGIGAAKFNKCACAYFAVDDEGCFDTDGTDQLYAALKTVASESFMTKFPRQKELEWAGFNSLCAVITPECVAGISDQRHGDSFGARAMGRFTDTVVSDAAHREAMTVLVDSARRYAFDVCQSESDDEVIACLYDDLLQLKMLEHIQQEQIDGMVGEIKTLQATASSEEVRIECDAAVDARALAEARVVELEREIEEIRSQERAEAMQIDTWKGEAERLSDQLRQAQASSNAVDSMMLPSNCAESLALAESLWSDRLVITDAARKSAKDFVNGDFREMFTHLQALAVVLWPIVFEEKVTNPQEEFQNRSSVEMTFKTNRRVKESMFDDEYMIEYKGERVRMDPHTKGKNKRRGYALRVHFFFDHEDKKIVIGHAGDHLRTTLTPKLH